jgi:hypothetical protein
MMIMETTLDLINNLFFEPTSIGMLEESKSVIDL